MTQEDNQNPDVAAANMEEILEDIIEEEDPGENSTPSQDDEIVKLREQLARSQADYQNLSRRSAQEKIEMTTYLRKDVVSRILPSLDNLDRAIEHLPEDIKDHQWVQGIMSMQSAWSKVLADMGVEVFDSIGEEVDADKHDVISAGPGDENVVVNEFEKGYKMGDQIIRHAKVVVGNGQ